MPRITVKVEWEQNKEIYDVNEEDISDIYKFINASKHYKTCLTWNGHDVPGAISCYFKFGAEEDLYAFAASNVGVPACLGKRTKFCMSASFYDDDNLIANAVVAHTS